jgi:shikimate 5-dehydrogenase
MQYLLDEETCFLKEVKAEQKIDGLLMLIGQAYHAFKLWNEIEFEKSYEEILGSLRGRT